MSDNFNNFPKVNLRKQESRINSTALKLKIYKTIEKLEKESSYQFESYEVDAVLLEMIQDNHRSYLKHKFGNDAE